MQESQTFNEGQGENHLASSLITSNDHFDTQKPKTSYYSAMFGLMSSALGTGIFNLPLRVSQIGIISLIVYVFLGGIFSYYGCRLLQKLIEKGFKTYSLLCDASYGNKLKRILQISIVLFPWGIGICYQVIIARFAIQLLVQIFGLDELYQNPNQQILSSKGTLIRIIINIGVIVSNYFLIRLKDITKIQRLSAMGVFSIFYNATTIFVLLFTGFTHKGQIDVKYNGIIYADWGNFQIFVFKQNAFSSHVQAIASVIYCYINHQLVFATCNNLANPTQKRLKNCFFRSNLYEFFLYIIIGLSGYLLLVQHQDTIPIAPMILTNINVWPMTVGKCLMMISLYLTIPLNYFPARAIILEAFDLDNSNKNFEIVSFLLAFTSSLVAILFTKINTYFGLLGGTVGVLIGGGIPAICYYKMIMRSRKEKNLKDYVIISTMIIIGLIGMVGGFLSVFDPI